MLLDDITLVFESRLLIAIPKFGEVSEAKVLYLAMLDCV